MSQEETEDLMFDVFWMDILEYADKIGYPTSYVEEEFLIDGELIKV